jgi:hypothetical protein
VRQRTPPYVKTKILRVRGAERETLGRMLGILFGQIETEPAVVRPCSSCVSDRGDISGGTRADGNGGA